MKLSLFTVLLCISLPLFAEEHPRLQLTSLKPLKISKRHLGKVTATLIRERDEAVIDQISIPLGDCSQCARGVAVKGVLGIRLEGGSSQPLNVMKKSASGVRYNDCKQLALSLGGEYQCTFSFRETTYTVKLESLSKRSAAK